jgi:ABC-2 type transport system ATP-binding protein
MTITLTASPAVRATGVRHRFGDTVAIDGVDFDVAAGTEFGLLGPNGAGKTTTLRMITTLLPAPRHKLAVRRLIGYVPQQFSADGALSGRENMALSARLFDVPRLLMLDERCIP